MKNGYELPDKVAVLYSDVKREYFTTERAYLTEKDSERNAGVIAKNINSLGVSVQIIPGNVELINSLRKYKPDMVLNLVDTYKGSDYQASIIPAVLKLLDIPYVGTSSTGLSLTTNKYVVSRLLGSNGIPVANSQLFYTPNDFLDSTLRFPLISKLSETHGSVDLGPDSVSENEKHLRERLKFLFANYDEQILVEEYIVGREVSAVLLEGLNKKVYFGEKVFPDSDSKYKFLTFDLKWGGEKQGVTFQKYEDPVLKEYVKRAFAVTQMSDYARFDIRIDSSGRYFFLDCNANPFLGPSELGGSMSTILDLNGVSFEETITRLLINTVRDTLGKERLQFPKSANTK